MNACHAVIKTWRLPALVDQHGQSWVHGGVLLLQKQFTAKVSINFSIRNTSIYFFTSYSLHECWKIILNRGKFWEYSIWNFDNSPGAINDKFVAATKADTKQLLCIYEFLTLLEITLLLIRNARTLPAENNPTLFVTACFCNEALYHGEVSLRKSTWIEQPVWQYNLRVKEMTGDTFELLTSRFHVLRRQRSV